MSRTQPETETLEPETESRSGDVSPDSGSPPARPRSRRRIVLAVGGVVAVVLLIFGARYVAYARAHESTDDAFIDGAIVGVSPKVASNVARVYVDDNTHVKAGDLLVELDPRDFEARLAQARGNLAAAQAEAVRAHVDAGRYERLVERGFVSLQDRDNAVAKDRVAAGQVDQLTAAVHQAELDLSYTKLYAPEAGRVTRKSVEPGAYVQVGQTLFSIVPDRVWVVANFKETQLRHMRPGQPATVMVDAYPDRVFHGHVDSIQAGSGARFSLLPPENATGNYVKVVQRVPVKIVIDETADPQRVLGPGMSAVPEVRVR